MTICSHLISRIVCLLNKNDKKKKNYSKCYKYTDTSMHNCRNTTGNMLAQIQHYFSIYFEKGMCQLVFYWDQLVFKRKKFEVNNPGEEYSADGEQQDAFLNQLKKLISCFVLTSNFQAALLCSLTSESSRGEMEKFVQQDRQKSLVSCWPPRSHLH